MTFFRLGAEDPMGEWELKRLCVLSNWAASRGLTASRGVERAQFAHSPREHFRAASVGDMSRDGGDGGDGVGDEVVLVECESKEEKRKPLPQFR